MGIPEQELQKAIEFVRKTFAEREIQLDYTPASVKHLDKLFDQEFKDGRLKRPDSSFAKYQGLIMIGVSGYLAEVILKNTTNTTLQMNGHDSNWYINFNVAGSENRAVQPGKVVLARIQDGKKSELYPYVLFAVKYFGGILPATATPTNSAQKPWWKFW